MRDKATRKYVERYAEPELSLASRLAGAQLSYDNVVIVPAKGEAAQLLDGLRPAMQRALAIVVVNATDSEPPAVHTINEATLASLRSHAPRELDGAHFGTIAPGFDLLVIDRATSGRRLPRREGVGLARKIGCDIALGLKLNGTVRSRWIHMSDADVRLPSGYFSASDGLNDAVALTYPFEHVPSGCPAVDEAHRVYEIYLRYYVAALAWSGSAYAFHTIGSTLAVDAHAYTVARGVPKRQAGEDFYLLNKLAKLGPIVTPDCQPIAIVARRSERVPFGTGRATAEMASTIDYRIYHPAIFELLRRWHDVMHHFARHRSLPQSIEDLQPMLALLEAEPALSEAAAQTQTETALTERLRQWFDGFRTLRFVHTARDRVHGTMAWRDALAAAPFINVDAKGSAEAIRTELAQTP